METVWKLRPNIKWHDGHPFTSDDLVFTFQVNRDTEVAGVAVLPSERLIDSVSAPDPLTLIMYWNSPYVDADNTTVVDLLPKHLFEEMYRTDKSRLSTTPLTSTEFIGLGPYKLVNWDRGTLFQADRFDEYYRGRPPLDTIYVRFVDDPNTLVATILAEAVDVVVSYAATGVNLDQAAEVQKRWAGTRNQVLMVRGASVYFASPQYRPEYSTPPGVIGDLAVRRALLHAMDRQTLTDVMTHGFSPVADSYFQPDEPRRAEMEPSIVKYDYDPTRAAQLLTEAGWQRGQDGVLRRQSDGQRFDMDFWVRAGINERVASVVADEWQRIGVATNAYIIPATRATDREYEAKRPGFLCCVTVPLMNMYRGNLHQRQINTAATNWTGLNYGAYVNPKADSLLDRMDVTLDPRARLPLEQELVHEYTSDVALFPLWWQVLPQLMLAGVKGPRPDASYVTVNMFEWDRE
jgi:peptide/nickel transport system substrate-binding protein